MAAISHSPESILIHCGELLTPTERWQDCWLTVEARKVARLSATEPARNGIPLLDASDAIVVPGLIDLQVNGALGWGFQSSDRAHFDAITQYHAAHGTTSLLPTLVSAPEATLLESLTALAEWMPVALGASVPGLHLEGPFLSPERRGSHEESALRLPYTALVERFVAAAHGALRMLTLAPELPGASAAIERLVRQGIIVSAGHSAATYDEMQTAVVAGLCFVTHAGNVSDWPHRAMNAHGFLSSEPGVVGALMADTRLGGSIIMDGFHFHPALLRPLLTLKGTDRLLLVSDAAPIAGCAPGEYERGGLQVRVHPEGYATSGRGGGWLAGSTITLLDAVQRAVRLAGLTLQEAVSMATLGPARLLGIERQKGLIAESNDADLLILNQDLSARQVLF